MNTLAAGDFAPHLPELRSLALRLCGRADDAAELVQETLARAVRARLLPRGRDLLAWLICVLRNLFIDGWRQRGREVLVEPHSLEETVAANDPEPEPRWA